MTNLSPCPAWLALTSLVCLQGCLNTSHKIPKQELMALSQSPVNTRGQRVRVVQDLGHEAPPPAAPGVQAGTSVYVGGAVWVGGTPRRSGYRPGPVASNSGRGFGLPMNLADQKKQSAKVWYVAAAVAALALATTEGARYDGWVAVHPMHPVHLYGYRGEYTWMPLAEVTPDVVAWSQKAVIRSTEGPWQPLGRAPLNRQGFTYSLLLGGGEVAILGAEPEPGFLGHIQFGYFPTRELGLQFDLSYGWADDTLGNTVFDGRYALELDFLPLAAGVFHAGGYGQIGVASRSDDGIQFDDSSGLFAVGALMQLELTTRLALTARAGVVRAHDETLAEFTAGVSIY